MTDSWAIEAHDTTGKPVFFRSVVGFIELQVLVPEILAEPTTGGIVIYRSIVATSNKKVGDDDDEQPLGLVTDLPETMFRTRMFEDTTDEQLTPVVLVPINETADDEWYGVPLAEVVCVYCHIQGGHDADCSVIS